MLLFTHTNIFLWAAHIHPSFESYTFRHQQEGEDKLTKVKVKEQQQQRQQLQQLQ